MLWHHPDAILCCSFKEKPMFTFANKAGLDMLETSLIALQDLKLDKIFDESGRKALFSDISKLMEQVLFETRFLTTHDIKLRTSSLL
uniref:Rld1 n=1 Tax=Arundo donax TaxID=35708 RepID=A0A0A9B080_ARUDO